MRLIIYILPTTNMMSKYWKEFNESYDEFMHNINKAVALLEECKANPKDDAYIINIYTIWPQTDGGGYEMDMVIGPDGNLILLDYDEDLQLTKENKPDRKTEYIVSFVDVNEENRIFLKLKPGNCIYNTPSDILEMINGDKADYPEKIIPLIAKYGEDYMNSPWILYLMHIQPSQNWTFGI